jgi:hypothetical protein
MYLNYKRHVPTNFSGPATWLPLQIAHVVAADLRRQLDFQTLYTKKVDFAFTWTKPFFFFI